MPDPVLSPDGFWQLDCGEWIASDKQTVALANGAIAHDAVDLNSSFERGSTPTRFFSNWKPEQKLYIFSGVCLASICLSLIIVLASLSPVTDSLVQVADCTTNNVNLVSSSGTMSAVSESGGQDESCPQEIEIASWNLKRFGPSGAADEMRVAEMAEKISGFDIIAVQEIKDIQQTSPYILQDEIDEISEYGMVLSNRTGSFCEAKSSSQISEQYAFYYDNETIRSLDSGQHYPNTDCEFTREPFAARFVSAEFDHSFVLITLHIDPDDAVGETSALVNVFEWAKFQYPDEDDFILLGDLNADCSYASSSELDELDIRNGDYQWIIPDGTNTNIAESSSCAYDRMIIGDGGSEEYLGSFSTDCELESSDHCIISAKFSAHEK
jgi:endonuclease/exonuclease/phosphatase family metal-dependent hydrolase